MVLDQKYTQQNYIMIIIYGIGDGLLVLSNQPESISNEHSINLFFSFLVFYSQNPAVGLIRALM